MNTNSNPKLTDNAKNLRKNMTKEERHLWYDFLKTLPITVNRQKVIGNYIVDFYIATAKLVIELDGSQHYEESSIKKENSHLAFYFFYFYKTTVSKLSYKNFTKTHIHGMQEMRIMFL